MNARPRLIDLHCDWPLQYATESTLFDPVLYADTATRFGQAEGYLGTTAAAVVACYRREADWAAQPDPWHALGELVARVEAEFPGRVLADPADLERWEDDPDGLCWAVLGVEGFDSLIRTASDLQRLPRLFTRGVRVFQPAYGSTGVLAGSSVVGDDRGLTDLGRAFLQTLADLGQPDGPRAVVDLAHLNPTSTSDVLAWFEADPARADRLLLACTHGAPVHPGFETPRAMTLDNLARLRALGGVFGFGVSPPFYGVADSIREGIEAAAALPFRGQPGYEGLAIGTDFLGVSQTLPGLGHAEAVLDWLFRQFPPETAGALVDGNARELIRKLVLR